MPIELYLAVMIMGVGLYLAIYPAGALIMLGVNWERCGGGSGREVVVVFGRRVEAAVAIKIAIIIGIVLTILGFILMMVSVLMGHGGIWRYFHVI